MLQTWPLLCLLSVSSTSLAADTPPVPPSSSEPAEPAPNGDQATDTATDSATTTDEPAAPAEASASVGASAATEPAKAPPMVIVRAGGAPTEDHEAEGEAQAGSSGGNQGGDTMVVPGTGSLLTTRGGSAVVNPGQWNWDFHGYFHAPMRIGLGRRGSPAEGQGERTYHAPLVPDDSYLSWQHTKHNPREWAELYFSYGNDVARGVVSIEAFNFTDAHWNEQNAQFGIAKAFLLITPRINRLPLRLRWRIGAGDNRYGQAGRHDGGEYETYLFGRTRGIGETLRAEIPVRSLTFVLEHGIGATRPDPNEYALSKFTVLNHAHAGVMYRKMLEFNFHYLMALSAEEDRDGEGTGANPEDVPDGKVTVLGPELRFDGGRWGYLYGGFSWIKLQHARTVSAAFEVIHSNGGGNFTTGLVHNYLEGPVPGFENNDSNGNGNISTVLLQAEHSLKKMMHGDEFWGQGRDVGFKFYTMWNKVASQDEDMNGVAKFKYGADVYLQALRWLGAAVRYDRVQPNSRIPEQSFSVLSPRLIFRTDWITHEEIRVQYSRYFYNRRACGEDDDPAMCLQPPAAPTLPDGFGATTDNQDEGTRGAPQALADIQTVAIQAAIWW